MSTLTERIEGDLLAAMKQGDTIVRDTLRLIKTAVKNKEIELGQPLTDEEVVTILQKESKARQEAMDQYQKANRTEQAAKEKAEQDIVAQYLPAQLSDEDLKKMVQEAIASTGATTAADMGKVIGAVMSKVKGQADGSRISTIARQLLL